VLGHDSAEQFPDEPRYVWLKGLPILGGIWLAGAIVDRTWLALDHSVPPWDPADYLTGALTYRTALTSPQWFSGSWWTDLWLLSSKIPPFFYIFTVPFLTIFGTGTDQSFWVMLLYSAILLAAVYTLGTFLFEWKVGLWAAILSTLMPSLYQLRLEFLLDYPLTAIVTLCFTCLTLWRGVSQQTKKETTEPLTEPLTVEKKDEATLVALDEILPSRPAASASDPAPSATIHASAAPHSVPQNSAPRPLAPYRPWLLAVLFGITLGLAFMTKQTSLLFMLVPMLWVLGEVLWRREWQRFGQFGLGLVVSLPIWFPWYRVNWLLILTSSKRATIDSAIAEGQAPVWSLRGLTLYLAELPGMVSLTLLLVPLVGIILFWRRSRMGRGAPSLNASLNTVAALRDHRQQCYAATQRSLGWLLIFILGAYLMSTLNPNKDTRYIAPYLPAMSVLLAYGMTLFPRSWRVLPWATISLAVVLMLSSLFPIFVGQGATQRVSQFFPYQGKPYPHAQVIAEIVQAEPHLISTIGVLPSTPEVNQHNINYYGLLQNGQVFGRQVGDRPKNIEPDRRSLTWFLTKTDDQGAIRKKDAQTALVQAVEQGKDFQLHQTWALPDQSSLKLYHRTVAAVEVRQANDYSLREASNVARSAIAQSPKSEVQKSEAQKSEVQKSEVESATVEVTTPEVSQEVEKTNKLHTIPNLQPEGKAAVRLDQITLPGAAPAGKPIPVTYQWSGTWDSLQPGLMILTWQRQGDPKVKGSTRWLHDHGIGRGELYPAALKPDKPTSRWQVTERMAMLPPATTAPGVYTLAALYLNRHTGKTEAIALPPITLKIDPTVPATPAPELDLLTQLRNLAATLPQGAKSLERISNEVARINQYDPVQDYLLQVKQATEYRFSQDPKNVQHAYTLALANALMRQVNPAIAALQKATQLDSQNPYAYAYLAFVNLYDFRPGAAQTALQSALKLNPASPEVQALTSIAFLMQGNVIQAWQHFQAYQKVLRQDKDERVGGVERSRNAPEEITYSTEKSSGVSKILP
jgi:4-amino-4-deoxy-L-arabinose transferase-like glycosyltransferase/tetratricopeptide (TPR) repeat protein